MADPTLISAIGAAIAGAGGGGALVAWRKAGVEAESIAVSTLRSVIGELRIELDDKESEIKLLRGRLDAAEQLINEFFHDPPGHVA